MIDGLWPAGCLLSTRASLSFNEERLNGGFKAQDNTQLLITPFPQKLEEILGAGQMGIQTETVVYDTLSNLDYDLPDSNSCLPCQR